MEIDETNLDFALKEFINHMRIFVSSKMQDIHGDSWERKYYETLKGQQKIIWTSNRQEVDSPLNLIDFGNLSVFAKNSKIFNDITRNGWKYHAKLNDINEARNMIAHYSSFDKDKSNLAFAQMISIAKELELTELKTSLRDIQNNTSALPKKKNVESTKKPSQDKLRQRPKIRKVINVILNTLGISIEKSKTNLSTINSNGIYSVEPNFERQNDIWHLILINTQKRKLYIFSIPPNHSIYRVLYRREDKKVFRLLFDIDDLTFREHLSHERLENFLVGEYSYDDDVIF